jgi:metal-responsive CopG/Arc/MetJ family transcriptional regulator
MSMQRVTITLSKDTLEYIDEFRGLVKRSNIIENILVNFIEKNPTLGIPSQGVGKRHSGRKKEVSR